MVQPVLMESTRTFVIVSKVTLEKIAKKVTLSEASFFCLIFLYFHLLLYLNPLPPGTFLDIDECHSTPCKNNGTCVDKINSYTCKCKPGFEGKNCETSMLSNMPSISVSVVVL